MVQRKPDNKLGTKPESKNSMKSEKRSGLRPSQKPDTRGGSELKKKMKKMRSFKVSNFGNHGSPLKQEDLEFSKLTVYGSESVSMKKKLKSNRSPNYMKPTSNSDAKKDSSEVSTSSRITVRKNSKFSTNLKHGGRGSQPKNLPGSGLKPKRVLTKASGAPSYPKLSVNRATCSSTLKDYKSPASLVLNPGGSEYEGTSVMKVCPYTYCSLNGHHHAPLPPLKRFLSAKRRSLKTQKKSMGLRLFIAKKEIDTGQVMETEDSSISEADRAGLAMSALIEDFFVEIYTAPMVEPVEPKDYENRKQNINKESDSEVFNKLSNVTYDEISCETEMEEEFRKIAESELEEQTSETSIEDDLLDQDHDFHVVEMDVHVDSGWVLEGRDLSNELSYKQADQAEKGCEGCVGSDFDEDCESITETQLGESIYEASDMDWEAQEDSYPDNEIYDYARSDDGSDSATVSLQGNWESVTEELSFEPEDLPNTCTEAPEEAEVLQDGSPEHTGSPPAAICSNSESKDTESDSGEVFNMCNGQTQNQISRILDLNHTQVELESISLLDRSSVQETEEIMSGSTEVIVYSSIFLNLSDDASAKHEIREENSENPKKDTVRSNDNEGYLGEPTCNSDVEGKIRMDEKLGANGANIIQDCDSLQDVFETNQSQINPVIDGEETQPDEKEDGWVLEGQVSALDSPTDQVIITSDQNAEQALPNADLRDKIEMKELDSNVNSLLKFPVSDSHQGNSERDPDMAEKDQEPGKTNTEIEDEGGEEAFCDLNDMSLEENKQLDAAETCLDLTIIQDCDSPKIIMDEQLGVNDETIIHGCDSLQEDLEMEQSQINPVIDGEETQPAEEEDSCALEGQVSDSLSNDSQTDQAIITRDQCAEQALPNADLGDRTEMKEQDNNADELLAFQISHSQQGDSETDQDIAEEDQDPGKTNTKITVEGSQEAFCDLNSMLLEENKQLAAAETFLDPTEDGKITNNGTGCNQVVAETRSNLRERKNIKRKVAIEDQNGDKKFDPRAPRFLPVELDPEAEKVDLRHQMMDERKSAEEWMVDYALRQAVSKLTPRKRRVALLVEAFETVMPSPKWETHLQHSAASFTHTRSIQACS